MGQLACSHCGCQLDLHDQAAKLETLEALLAFEGELQGLLAVVQRAIQQEALGGNPGQVQIGRYRATWRKSKTWQFQGWEFKRSFEHDPEIGPLIEKHTAQIHKEFFKVEFI